MKIEEIEKFKRHMGLPKKYMIGEDEFEFKPLTVKNLPDLMELAYVSQQGENEILKPENSKIIIRLLTTLVKNSYPEMADEEIDNFVMVNLFDLQNILLDLNQKIMSSDADLVKKRIEMMNATNTNKRT